MNSAQPPNEPGGPQGPGSTPPGPPGPPSGGLPPSTGPRNGFGITSIVCGIVGVVGAFIPIIGCATPILGVVGIVFGVLGIGRAKQGVATNRGVAISGVVLSAIALVLFIIAAIVAGTMLQEMDWEQYQDY